jgi:molybdate transport system substrate-binding protein
MKGKWVFVFFVLLSNFAFAKEIYWYAAASATKPAQEIVKLFNEQSNETKVVLISGGSGELLNKIVISKVGDIYSPANTKYAKLAEEKVDYKYQKLLIQTIVFGLSENGESKVNSFYDLLNKDVKVAIGNPDTMASGKTFYEVVMPKLKEEEQQKLKKNIHIDPINMSQTLNYLKTNTIDAGILYDSTSRANKLKFIYLPKEYEVSDFYYIGITKFCSNKEEAEKFIEFVKNQKNVFTNYGFEMVVE